jgi:hypothetical protein
VPLSQPLINHLIGFRSDCCEAVFLFSAANVQLLALGGHSDRVILCPLSGKADMAICHSL